MTERLIAVFIWVILFAVTAMIVGAILDFVPWDIRRYLGYVIIPVAVLWFLWSWFKWHAKQRGDQNELNVLEETVQEHERGSTTIPSTSKSRFSMSSATTSVLRRSKGCENERDALFRAECKLHGGGDVPGHTRA